MAGKQSNLKRAELGLRRRNSVLETGAVSAEEISNARNGVDAARAELSIAQQRFVARQSLVQGGNAEHNPEAIAAKAVLDKALLDLERTAIRAPVDGVVASRHAQIGQRVKVGSTLMSVVPLMDAHVDANFKEVQLRDMRIGQPVTLTADAYGSAVQYHGTIAGLGVGTGGAFALLPAQNATGNWIKVVQRIPVRIALDPQELVEHPLRVGLSMEVTVNVADKSGKTLASASRVNPAFATNAFERDVEQADALVRSTIAANLGHALPASGTSKSAAAKSPVTGVALAPRTAPRASAAAL